MRILVAMMKHETNSFSPVVTNLDRFAAWGLHRDDAVISAYRGTRMPIAAYIDLAEKRNAELVSPVAAEAMPSGLVEEQTYEQLCDWILEPIRQGSVDAAFLDLHGAMTAHHIDDGEGELLRRIRDIAPDLPIAVTLDLHTNLTDTMITHCDALIGYKTYPHTDMYEVGEQIANVLWQSLDKDCKPVMAYKQIPVLAQTLRMGTADEPMLSLQQATREMETQPGVLAATVFGGFPMVDVAHAGASVVVVTDGDSALAEQCCEQLSALVWDQRQALIYAHRPVASTIKEAQQEPQSPVVLLDHADNVGSGGTSDVMTIIEAVLDAGLEDVAVAAVFDPDAVQHLQSAGLNQTVEIQLGGKMAMPSIGLTGTPLTLTGKVSAINDGRWIVQGPMYTGVQVDTGPTAVFTTGNNVNIVITSLHHEPWDAGILFENGIDPLACRYLLLKSRIHYRAGFAPLAKATYTLDGVGVTTSDNTVLQYHSLRRPIYPLDFMK